LFVDVLRAQDKRKEAERKRELAAREAAAAEEEKRLRAEADERARKREAAAAAAAEAARLAAEEEERARVAQAMEDAKTKRSLRVGNLAIHGTKRGARALPRQTRPTQTNARRNDVMRGLTIHLCPPSGSLAHLFSPRDASPEGGGGWGALTFCFLQTRRR